MPNPRYPAPSQDARLPPERVHALGARPLLELLRELERDAELHPALETYAGLPADFIRAHGGDRLPEPRLVAGGHFRRL